MNPTEDYWDLQFRFARILPDFQKTVDWLAAASAAASVDLGVERYAHGADPRQFAESLLAPAATPHADAAVVPAFIHGGYWRAFAAADQRALMTPLLGVAGRAGNIEYRLMPGARIAALIDDVCAGVSALVDADPRGRKLLLIGHSAGAHLALEAARRPETRAKIAGVFALSGIYDLRPIRWTFLQAEIALTDSEVAAHSPLDDPPDIALRIGLGADETSEYHRQARALSAAAGAPVLLEPGADHMAVLPALADPESATAAAARAFAAELAAAL